MLNSLRVAGFKSWKDSGPIRLAPVTGLFGTNSSGKTSLLQSLLLMRQTSESADRNRVFDLGGNTSLVDLGTYGDISFQHDSDVEVSMRLAWTDSKEVLVQDLLAKARRVKSVQTASNELAVSFTAKLDSPPRVTRLSYEVGNDEFSLRLRELGDGFELFSDTFDFVRAPMRAWALPSPSRFYSFPDQVRLYYQNAGFLSDLELRLEQQLGRILYLGPLRDDPRRQYIFAGGAPQDVGQRGELAVDALVAARLSNEKRSRGWQRSNTRRRKLPAIPIEQLIAEWLVQLGLIEDFEVESLDDRQTLYRVNVRKTHGSTRVLLTDVGFGVSQVFPVLVLLAYAKPGDTILLEQPEIHLHPSVQASLADIILETALARGVQVIVESHSEHLLTRLQRRIAERDLERGIVLAPQDVALYFVDQFEGTSRLRELQLDLFGNISNWPENFFGDSLADSVAMVVAAAEREEDAT